MANVEANNINPPNQSLRDGDVGSTASMGRSASPMMPPNAKLRNGDEGSTASLARTASGVHRPDHKFDINDAKMPQPPSVVQPGKGSVPVNPFQKGTKTANLPDSTLKRGK